jgi:Ca2+-binding EF-hand superfamily protein
LIVRKALTENYCKELKYKFYSQTVLLVKMEEELRQAFALFDQNGDQVVTESELSEIFQKLGGHIKPAESLDGGQG